MVRQFYAGDLVLYDNGKNYAEYTATSYNYTPTFESDCITFVSDYGHNLVANNADFESIDLGGYTKINIDMNVTSALGSKTNFQFSISSTSGNVILKETITFGSIVTYSLSIPTSATYWRSGGIELQSLDGNTGRKIGCKVYKIWLSRD